MGATSSIKGGQPRASTTASKAPCRFLDPAVLHSPVKPTAVYPSIPASVTSEKRASFSVSSIPPDRRAQTQSPTSLIHLRKQADETFAIATAAENSGLFKKACDAYELAADFFKLAETAATALPGNTDVKALKDAQVRLRLYFTSPHPCFRFYCLSYSSSGILHRKSAENYQRKQEK
jgi:hypothetical protein